MFISKQAAKSEILDNRIYQQKAAELSFFQRNQSTDTEKPAQELGTAEPMRDTKEITEVPKEQEETSEAASDDSGTEPIVKKRKVFDPDTIVSEIGSTKKSKIEQSEFFFDLIMKSDLITIEGNNVFHIVQKPQDVKVSTILNALDVSPHLVANTYAKHPGVFVRR